MVHCRVTSSPPPNQYPYLHLEEVRHFEALSILPKNTMLQR